MGELGIHAVANLFPAMDDTEYRELVRDIQEHGLREPIWTHEGRIIDGRHRYRACAELGVEPAVREWNGEGSLVSFVISLNLRRRHLSAPQRAAVAVEMLPMLEAEAKERQRGGKGGTLLVENFPQAAGQKSRDIAAAAVGVNSHYVTDAKRIKEESPRAFQLMRSGRVSIPEAQMLADVPTQFQDEVLDRVEAEPETPVKTIVREHQQETSVRLLGNVPDRTGNREAQRLRMEWTRAIASFGKSVKQLDPSTYVPALQPQHLIVFRGSARALREWLDAVDAEIETQAGQPVRLVKRRNDAS